MTIMKHDVYFGEHPRPAAQAIDVRPGLTVWIDADGAVHTITASGGLVGTRELLEVLEVLRCAPQPNARHAYDAPAIAVNMSGSVTRVAS